MSKGLIDVTKLEKDFTDYKFSQSHGRIVKDVKFGQQLAKTSHATETIAIADKIRKQKKEESPYPIVKK